MNLSFKGVDELITKLDKLANKTESVMKAALYEGAKVAADEIKASLSNIPVEETSRGFSPFIPANSSRRLKGVTSRQKADIISNFGVSKHRPDGDGVSTRIGFHGYTVNGNETKRVAVAVIVRSVESGTTFREKTPFFRAAVRRAKPRAEAAMKKKVEEIINNVNRS